ncbi:unnamed protein product, partial [Oikopleura dioica]
KALDKFMSDMKIDNKLSKWLDMGGSKKQKKMDQITTWIEQNHPNWDKDEEGFYLVKQDAVKLESKCYISQLTLSDLKVFATHLRLDVDFTGKSKKMLVSEITRKALEKVPAFKCTKSGNLIIDPTLLQ